MLNLDITIINLALAAIGNTFHCSLNTLQSLLTTYMLAAAMLMILAGKLADLFGHKHIFLTGCIVFIASSTIAGLSPNIFILLCMRFFQGMGVALCFPTINALCYQQSSPAQKGLIIGICALATSLGQALGPTIGGLLINYFSWHWIFLINLPLGLSALCLVILFCPADLPSQEKHIIDWNGFLLSTLALFLILFAIYHANTWQITSIKFITMLISGLIVACFFIFMQYKSKHPFINFSAIINQTFLRISFLRMIMQYVFFTFLIIFALLLQNILGYSALKSGLIFLLMTATLGLISPFAGAAIDRIGAKIPNCFGHIFHALGCLFLLYFAKNQHLAFLYCSLFFSGLGIGVLFPTTTITLLKSTKEIYHGLASGIFFTLGIIAGSLGITINCFLLDFFSHHYLFSWLRFTHTVLSPFQQEKLTSMANGSINQTYFPSFANITTQAFYHGLFYITLSCCILSLIGALYSLHLESLEN